MHQFYVSKIFFVLIVVVCIFLFRRISTTHHPHSDLNTEELIKVFNYPCKVYNVLTEDNYILTVHRIPHGRNSTKKPTTKKLPVLLVPGMFNTAADFVYLGPGRALALLLADRNYDVWLANVRGTTSSRKHLVLNPDKDAEFWNFTINEIGVFDIPAMIDLVLNVTKEEKLNYIGFSKGTSEYFIALSERPEYSKKIQVMIALAPAICFDNIFSPVVQFISSTFKLIRYAIFTADPFEIFPAKGIFAKAAKFICDKNSVFFKFCEIYYYQLQGNFGQINLDLLPVIHSNIPGGASSYVFLHLLQIKTLGILMKFDYGKDKNLLIYGQTNPPKYNYERVTPPTIIYFSNDDGLINATDVERVAKILPNVVKMYSVPSAGFNHMDFLIGQYSAELVYNSVIEEMDKY